MRQYLEYCADHDAQGGFERCKSRVKSEGLAGPGGVVDRIPTTAREVYDVVLDVRRHPEGDAPTEDARDVDLYLTVARKHRMLLLHDLPLLIETDKITNEVDAEIEALGEGEPDGDDL